MELDEPGISADAGAARIWLSQETGRSGTEWQLGLFVRIEGAVELDVLDRRSAGW